MSTHHLPDAVLYADLDDEVTVLYENIKRLKKRRIAVVLPQRSHILSSLVNLKILRHKLEKSEIQATIVTADDAGRTVAHEAGFSTASKITHPAVSSQKKPELEEYQEAPQLREKLGRRHLELTSAEDAADPTIIDRNDIPLAKLPKIGFFRRLWVRISGGVESEEMADDGAMRYTVRRPSVVLLSALFVAAAALLFFIIYIAVPTATVYLSPRADPLSQVVSVQLLPKASEQPAADAAPIVPAEYLDITFTHDLREGATGKHFEGTDAHGTVTLYNRSPKDKDIVASRLKSKEGLIFYTKAPLTIPAGTPDAPGKIDAEVLACRTDDTTCDCIHAADTCKGDFVGQRGNIGPSFFTMPAIPSVSPALYWAESTTPFVGGTTQITTFIAPDDITHVKDNIARDIMPVAMQELKAAMDQRTATLGGQWTVLPDKKAMDIQLLSVQVPPNLENAQQNDFPVTVTAHVRGIIYNEEALRSLMLARLTAKVHPEKRLGSADFTNMALQIEDVNLNDKHAQIAVTLSGVEAYDISEETAAGARLVNKIRSNILGTPVADAEQFIRNLPEINNASISSWPFWAQTIPELPENVRFRIK